MVQGLAPGRLHARKHGAKFSDVARPDAGSTGGIRLGTSGRHTVAMEGSKGGAWRLHPRAFHLRKLVWVGPQGGARRPAPCARSNGGRLGMVRCRWRGTSPSPASDQTADVCMVRERLNASNCAKLGDATGRAAAPCQDARVLPAHILHHRFAPSSAKIELRGLDSIHSRCTVALLQDLEPDACEHHGVADTFGKWLGGFVLKERPLGGSCSNFSETRSPTLASPAASTV